MRRNQGFTLAEIIIALAVLGVVVGFGFQAISSAYITSRIAGDITLLTLVTQTRMEELLTQNPVPGDSAGACLHPYQDFQWKATVTRELYRYQIRLEVTGREQSMKLVHYLTVRGPVVP